MKRKDRPMITRTTKTGKVSISSFNIMKKTDSSSPLIFQGTK